MVPIRRAETVTAMKKHTLCWMVGCAALTLSACAPEALDESATRDDEARLSRRLDRATGATLIGASADHRYVAYGVACDAGDQRTELRLLDARTGSARTLARGWMCAPGSVTFSPDGSLAVYGLMGSLRAVSTANGRTVTVSREGQSGVGVAFSPDSSWFAVASLNGAAATIDAWERDLRSHVEVSHAAYANPFGAGDAGLKVSPDGRSLLFLGDVTGPFPIGALSLWSHSTRSLRVIEAGVSAMGYSLTSDWRRIAYVGGVAGPAEGQPPTPDAFAGDLTVRDLSTGRRQVVESHVTPGALEFARNGDVLVYTTGGGFTPGALSTLKACAWGAAPVTLDSEVYAMFAPAKSVVVSPAGDRVAYAAALVPERFVAELRVATLPSSLSSSRMTVVAHESVPGAMGYNRDGALVYLHTPTAGFPMAVGALSAMMQGTGAVRTLGTEVAQAGLRIDASRCEVMFVSGYDAGNAIGSLRFWDGVAQRARTLGTRAAVMSLTPSPTWQRVAFVTLAEAPLGEVPTTTLRVARLTGAPSTVRVEDGVTSQLVDDDGRALYTTDDGLYTSTTN